MDSFDKVIWLGAGGGGVGGGGDTSVNVKRLK